MQFTKIVHLIGGEKILITEAECLALVDLINKSPQGFVKIQNSLINKSSIAYIGDHHATNYLKKMELAQEKTNLKITGGDVKQIE